jgi:electron transport complex protein RnfA
MNGVSSAAWIVFTAILTNNFVLCKFLGICPFLGVSKKVNTAMGMSVAVIFVMLMSTAATWHLNQFLESKGLGYLQTIVCILIIAALVQLVEITLKKYVKSLYNALGIYLPLITTNCAVLGVCIANIDASYSYIQSLANSFGAAVGFTLALILFAGVRSTKLVNQDGVPKAFRGVPLVLLSSAILSLSFMGFSGMFS